MLWPLPFKPVGQHHGQARQALPFVLTTGNKLIDHHLGTIGKIAKLSFPNNQALGRCSGIAIFKGQYRLFREH